MGPSPPVPNSVITHQTKEGFMKLLTIVATVLFAGCQTTTPKLQTECVDIGSESGHITLCPLPAGIVCIEKNKQLSCLQLQEARSY